MDSHTHHPLENFGQAFAIGVCLNLAFVLVEAFYGWKSGSLALLADAAHNLGDVGALLLAWAAYGAGKLRPNQRHSYGWRRGSILAGLVNASLLLAGMSILAWEAYQRLQNPSTVDAQVVMAVAGIGVMINTATAWLFISGSRHDLNIRGAFLHMAADALVSLGVVVAAVLYLWLGLLWIDSLVSLCIALIVLVSAWGLFKQSLHLLMDGVPEEVDLTAVHSELEKLAGVVSVHDLHVWAISTADTALSAHLVVLEGCRGDDLLTAATEMLHDRFKLTHVVLQQESELFSATCPTACGC